MSLKYQTFSFGIFFMKEKKMDAHTLPKEVMAELALEADADDKRRVWKSEEIKKPILLSQQEARCACT